MKKHLLTNSKSGGGVAKLNSNAFTLIELLAIIVILAIIAVITVPIILGIIEDASKNAATDSAYGYKDAVNKYYVSELLKPENRSLILNGPYDVSTGGVLDGNGISNKEIPVSGDKPSSGYLNYINNTLTTGCLVFGDYAVTFNDNGTTTEKGECPANPNIEDTCPGPNCVYAFHGNYDGLFYAAIDGSPADTEDGITTELTGYNSDYTQLKKNGNQRTFFNGFILDGNIIKRAFACRINANDGKVYCLEGYNADKFSSNMDFIEQMTDCTCDFEDSYGYPGEKVMYCSDADASTNGSVSAGNSDDYCAVFPDGSIFCVGT